MKPTIVNKLSPLFLFELLLKADNGYVQHIDESKNSNRDWAFTVVSRNREIGVIQAVSAVWVKTAGLNRSASAPSFFFGAS